MRITFDKYDELIELKSLKKNSFQKNKHPKEQIERLAQIMEKHGVRHPIHISKRSGQVCFGHGRWAAAKLNKWTKFPVVYQDFESEMEEFACVQSDNAIASWADLDMDEIKVGIDQFKDLDIDLLGIKDFQIDQTSEMKGLLLGAELEDKPKIEKEETMHILEVHLSSEAEMIEVYEKLLERGLIVKYR